MTKFPIKPAFEWFTATAVMQSDENVCSQRDVFQARIDRWYRDLSKLGFDEKQVALLVAIVGEIGNNAFDHNLGQWQDIPGCWLEHGRMGNSAWCVVADRGQGLLNSLRRIRPALKNDQEALKVAFTEVLSGRSPEKRGNGLKFVKKVLEMKHNRGLCMVSGAGVYKVGGLSDLAWQQWSCESDQGKKFGKGVFALIAWEF